MRPRSIILFERLYLVSLLILLVQQIGGYFVAQQMIAAMPVDSEMPEMRGLFSGIVAGSIVFAVAMAVGIPLLLAWLAARKRIEVAKWLLLAVSILSVLQWSGGLVVLLVVPLSMFDEIGGITTLQLLMVALDGLSEAIGIFALWYLFRPDATAWFRSAAPPASADVFR